MSVGPSSTGDYAGMYEGIVVDVTPPAGVPASSVRVRIIGVHDTSTPPEDLPWAAVVGPLGNLHGPVSLPVLYQPVWVSFRRGHAEFPLVMGAIFTGLDNTSESVETDIAGDERKTVRGVKTTISSAEQVVTSQRTELVKGKIMTQADETALRVSGGCTRETGRETATISGVRDTTVAAADNLQVGGDQQTTVLGSCDLTVAQDHTTEVMGAVYSRAYNLKGIPPMLSDAMLTEAVNGMMRLVAKAALIPGSSLTLDPIGVQTELRSLVRMTIQATVNLVLAGATVQLGGPTAFMPIALLGHVHVSPFGGLFTGPAVGPPGIGINYGVLG